MFIKLNESFIATVAAMHVRTVDEGTVRERERGREAVFHYFYSAVLLIFVFVFLLVYF